MSDAVNYGRIALLPKMEYSELVQYDQGDVVSYEADGSSYICHTKPPIGTLPTDKSYFQFCSLRGLPGEPGENGAAGPRGEPGENGETPYIGSNGNWWIGDIDTGETASGKLVAGENITITPNDDGSKTISSAGGGYIVYPEITYNPDNGHLTATGGQGVSFSIDENGHLQSEVM